MEISPRHNENDLTMNSEIGVIGGSIMAMASYTVVSPKLNDVCSSLWKSSQSCISKSTPQQAKHFRCIELIILLLLLSFSVADL